jgi:hypothetical protein
MSMRGPLSQKIFKKDEESGWLQLQVQEQPESTMGHFAMASIEETWQVQGQAFAPSATKPNQEGSRPQCRAFSSFGKAGRVRPFPSPHDVCSNRV